ncbi:glutathione S-transferase [Acaryochloris sp. IP29b_bin.137]|uniref:glutathione S-transferase n=1 Tax=Acaryochloris sp. IP29b_bin.137 TaxID=2969217 RepID=UPI00262213DA|nr:glutathione S-transferase [Acaryochloris sp. IP29b_bin.137]
MATYPILYSFRRCPYAMRARLALTVSRQVCELREVVLRDKPQEMLNVSPKGTVPVLIKVDGSVLAESLDIMMWALKQQDPERWLRFDPDQMMNLQALVAECDGPFKHHLDRYKYAQRYENTNAVEHRTEGSQFLEKLNHQLGETAYLSDQHRSWADMAIAPFVRQFANTDRQWFDAQPWCHLQAWLAEFLASDIFQQIMEKYPQWKSGELGPLFPSLSSPHLE